MVLRVDPENFLSTLITQFDPAEHFLTSWSTLYLEAFRRYGRFKFLKGRGDRLRPLRYSLLSGPGPKDSKNVHILGVEPTGAESIATYTHTQTHTQRLSYIYN